MCISKFCLVTATKKNIFKKLLNKNFSLYIARKKIYLIHYFCVIETVRKSMYYISQEIKKKH